MLSNLLRRFSLQVCIMNLVVNYLDLTLVNENLLLIKCFKLSLLVLSSVIAMNTAIVSSPSLATLPENVKKEKRGIYGLGVHGNHHHYDDSPIPPSHHVHGLPPLGPAHLAPVNLGAHYHTTITKKIGVPYPVPYPVKVRLEKSCNYNPTAWWFYFKGACSDLQHNL